MFIKEYPLVSVFMVTYNHEKYVAQAIESVLGQKTNFKIKLFIGEDCSTDNTRKICMEYAKKKPALITLICTETNSIKINIANVLTACVASGAKYIAYCEGDDYGTDPYKLQKQVDFLESNSDFSMRFTGAEIKDEMGWNLPDEHYSPSLNKDVLHIEDFILSYVSLVPTATLVIRNILPIPVPDVCIAMSGDIAVHILVADTGKAKYFPEKTAVYRNHPGGVTKSQFYLEKSNEELMKLLIALNKHLNFRHNAAFRQSLLNHAKVNLIFGAKGKKGLKKIKHYFKRMPDYIKYSDKINFKELVYYHAVLFFPFILKMLKKPNNKQNAES
jgi:glycosyltransferase involved in cell wall biosynthesis